VNDEAFFCALTKRQGLGRRLAERDSRMDAA
jgi:hypothetical protein